MKKFLFVLSCLFSGVVLAREPLPLEPGVEHEDYSTLRYSTPIVGSLTTTQRKALSAMGASSEYIQALENLAAIAESINIEVTRQVNNATGQKGEPYCDVDVKIDRSGGGGLGGGVDLPAGASVKAEANGQGQMVEVYKIKGPCKEVKEILVILKS